MSNSQVASQDNAGNRVAQTGADETTHNYDRTGRFWRGLHFSNGKQTVLRKLFVGYGADTRHTGNNLREIINEELTARELAHPDVVINLEIYKRRRSFLEYLGIPCTPNENAGRLPPAE